MRKSEVFELAALHADDAGERATYVERADYFFRYSTETLAASPTGSLARPLVLMLGNGYMHAWFDSIRHAGAQPPAQLDFDFGRPLPFVPQKIRAKRRAMTVAVVSVAIVALGAAAWWAI
jgi:hypothetical protein